MAKKWSLKDIRRFRSDINSPMPEHNIHTRYVSRKRTEEEMNNLLWEDIDNGILEQELGIVLNKEDKTKENTNILWEDLDNGIWEQDNGSLPSTIEKAKQKGYR